MRDLQGTILSDVRDIISNMLRPHCKPGPYAIIDYPNYLNPGDCAIWLGTRQFLEEAHGAPPAYISSLKDFNETTCRRLVGDGTIFFSGGGNLGSLYARHDGRRRAILEGLGANPVVMLPQSAACAGDEPVETSGTMAYLKRNPRVTVFAREKTSQALLAGIIGRPVPLCPDLAHVLALQPRGPGDGTMLLIRKDTESQLGASMQSRRPPQFQDWPDLPLLKVWNRAGKAALAILPIRPGRSRLMDFIAARKAREAVRAIEGHDIVVTDRLHGMILAHALGCSVIAIDNSTGKVASYWNTWKEKLPGILLAGSLEEAISLSQRLRDTASQVSNPHE